FRGAAAGNDPFYGGTLEWATTSPPPEFNFAVIPTVSSPYPNWDRADREHDRQQLEEGLHMLERGHETPASTVRDAHFDEILQMPSESPWPLVVALSVAVMFAMLLTTHFVIAAAFAGLTALAVGGWHWREPQEA